MAIFNSKLLVYQRVTSPVPVGCLSVHRQIIRSISPERCEFEQLVVATEATEFYEFWTQPGWKPNAICTIPKSPFLWVGFQPSPKDGFMAARVSHIHLHLSGWWFYNHQYEFVNGVGIIPYMKWKIKDVWNHQPVLYFEVTHESCHILLYDFGGFELQKDTMLVNLFIR